MSGRFERKYAAAWYELLEVAHFEHRIPISRAVKLAAEGGLPGQSEPFEMKLASARRHITKEKQRRAGLELRLKQQGPPEGRLEALTHRLLAQCEHRVSKLEDRARRGKERDGDIDELRKVADAAKAIALLVRQGARVDRPAPKAKDTPPSNGKDQPSDLVKQMAREIAARDTERTVATDDIEKDAAARR